MKTFRDHAEDVYYLIESMVRRPLFDCLNHVGAYSGLVDEHIYKMVLYPNYRAYNHWRVDALKAMINIKSVKTRNGSQCKQEVYYKGMLEKYEIEEAPDAMEYIIVKHDWLAPIASLQDVKNSRSELESVMKVFYYKTSALYAKKGNWADIKEDMKRLLDETVNSMRNVIA